MKNVTFSSFLVLVFLFFYYPSQGQDSLKGIHLVTEEYQILDLSKLDELSKDKNLTIDHVTREGFTVYGPKGLKENLLNLNVKFAPPQRKHNYILKGGKNYKSAEDFNAHLVILKDKFPHILELFSIGKSIEGRDLLVMKLSAKKYSDRVRPKFRYIGNMHGDETVGREILRLLIEDLAQSYGKDPYLTSLIDTTEIFIMPSMNPDGFMNAKRGNAHDIDLNRNFPEFSMNEPLYTQYREIETQHVMNMHKNFNFSLGGNFHGGAVVVNYPFDSIPHPFPFKDFIQDLAYVYASLNPSMKNSKEFQNGMINGYFWYPISGGLQDFSYTYYGTLDLTLEVSDLKYPPYYEIQNFYQENKESMINLISKVHQGIGFKLLNGKDVKVKIIDLKTQDDLGTFSSRNSEFYKVLPSSEYKFELYFEDSLESFSFTGFVEENSPPDFDRFEFVNF